MEKIIINAFGKDKPGLVYKISKIILSQNGNIENSKMMQLESDFTIMMLVQIDANSIKTLKNKLNEIKDLNISYSHTNKKETILKYKNYSFSISVADNEGIIYLYTELFKKNNINIESMETDINHAPISGFPIFNLNSILNIPDDLDINIIKKDLKNIAQDNNIEYKLRAI